MGCEDILSYHFWICLDKKRSRFVQDVPNQGSRKGEKEERPAGKTAWSWGRQSSHEDHPWLLRPHWWWWCLLLVKRPCPTSLPCVGPMPMINSENMQTCAGSWACPWLEIIWPQVGCHCLCHHANTKCWMLERKTMVLPRKDRIKQLPSGKLTYNYGEWP